MILKDLLSRTYTKEAINSITATHEFLSHKLPNWQAKGPFQSPITIGEERNYVWYSQPEYHDANAMHVPFLLDCHHLFVNAICFVCQNGIPGLGVSKEAWLEVAKSNKETQVGLNIAMVTDMIDRQSNSITQIVFGTKVEAEMRRRGYNNEAQFCATIRQWYNAEDTPGLPATERHRARMDMRNMLLDSVNLATFPPPGSHIGGMPIIMFEGIHKCDTTFQSNLRPPTPITFGHPWHASTILGHYGSCRCSGAKASATAMLTILWLLFSRRWRTMTKMRIHTHKYLSIPHESPYAVSHWMVVLVLDFD